MRQNPLIENKLFLLIAGFTIEIEFLPIKNLYHKTTIANLIALKYKRFIIRGQNPKSDYRITFKEKNNILFIKKNSNSYIHYAKKLSRFHEETNYQISISQFEILLRDILLFLLKKNEGIILHSSSLDHKIYGGILFIGRTGAGKSTVVNYLKSNGVIIEDDLTILRKINNQYYLFHTPFHSKLPWKSKSKNAYPLAKVLFLNKSINNKILSINKDKVVNRLKNSFYTNNEYYVYQMSFILKFISSYSNFFSLYFSKNKKELNKLFN